MTAPAQYVAWLNLHVGRNPRAQEHSDYLTDCIFDDLFSACAAYARYVVNGELTTKKNVGLNGVRSPGIKMLLKLPDEAEPVELDSNIDGVVLGGRSWSRGSTASAPLALENKTIQTAHGKARTNRYGDMRAYASHVHQHSPATIAAYTVVINTSLSYKNPDAFAATAKSTGTNKAMAASDTIKLFTKGTILRAEPDDPFHRCEALFILPVAYDGVTATAELVTSPPAPGDLSPFSYVSFLERICRIFERRFG